MSDLFITLLSFYLLILVGYIIGRILKKYNKKIRLIFSFILLYIFTPPLIIFAFILPNISLNTLVIIYIILFGVILVCTTQILVYFIFLRKRAKEERKRVASILMLVAMPNAMLFPLPIVLSVIGTNFVTVLVIFALTQIFIRSTIITYQSIYYSTENKNGDSMKGEYKNAIKKLLIFPPTIALIISIFLVILNVKSDNQLLIGTNDVISKLTTIFGAILIGILLVNINFEHISEFKKDFSIVVLGRVIFSFILFFILIQFFTFPSEIRAGTLTVLLLIYVDPPAVTNTTYAEHFDLDKDFTAFCVFAITILAIIYIPLILILGLTIF